MPTWISRFRPVILPAITLLLLWNASAVAQPAPQYYVKFELAKEAAFGGSAAGGEVFTYGYLPTPIQVSDTGCSKSGGVCAMCPSTNTERVVGSGIGLATGGQCEFRITAQRRCWSDANGYAASHGSVEMIVEDVVFSSPGTGNISVSLNLEIVNDLIGNQTLNPALEARVWINTGEVLAVFDPPTGSMTTPETLVPVNQPVQVKFLLRNEVRDQFGAPAVLAAAIRFASANIGGAVAKSTMATTPVFNVPAGVTVNSVQGNIANNVFAGEPSVPTESPSWSEVKARY